MIGPRQAVFGLAAVLLLVAGMAGWKAVSRTGGEPADRPLRIADAVADPLQIAVLGTSLTARYDWPQHVAARLSDCLGQQVEVTVIAKPGATSDWGVEQLDLLERSAADLVLVEFAANDADARDGLSLSQTEGNLRAIVARLSEDRAVALMTMSPAQGIRGWLRLAQGDQAELYRRLALELETGLIDMMPRWLARPRSERGLGRDGLHPDPEVANDIIVPTVSEWIGQAVGRDCQGSDAPT